MLTGGDGNDLAASYIAIAVDLAGAAGNTTTLLHKEVSPTHSPCHISVSLGYTGDFDQRCLLSSVMFVQPSHIVLPYPDQMIKTLTAHLLDTVRYKTESNPYLTNPDY